LRPGKTDGAAAEVLALVAPHVPSVVLEPVARERAPALRNLFELYAHDFSEVVPLDLGEDGRFDVALGDEWWTRDDCFPFFIRSDGKLAGFALARRGSRVAPADADTGGEVMDVAEFFVLRGARGRGVGAAAARALFAAFPGRWEIRIRRANAAALRFWSRVAEAWAGGPVARATFSAKGVEWDLLRVGPPTPA
jgi:predicted acetyltransferase